jgi:hypothetical protein
LELGRQKKELENEIVRLKSDNAKLQSQAQTTVVVPEPLATVQSSSVSCDSCMTNSSSLAAMHVKLMEMHQSLQHHAHTSALVSQLNQQQQIIQKQDNKIRELTQELDLSLMGAPVCEWITRPRSSPSSSMSMSASSDSIIDSTFTPPSAALHHSVGMDELDLQLLEQAKEVAASVTGKKLKKPRRKRSMLSDGSVDSELPGPLASNTLATASSMQHHTHFIHATHETGVSHTELDIAMTLKKPTCPFRCSTMKLLLLVFFVAFSSRFAAMSPLADL